MVIFFDYSDVGWQIPDRVAQGHRRAWHRLQQPGMWWHAEQKLEIATEVRNTEGIRDQFKASLSPTTIKFPERVSSELSDTALEAIYRITADPSRLSREWFDGLINRGLSDVEYVELVGTLVTILSIDDFHRALGLPLEPFPEPVAGDPVRRRPSGARDEGSWVQTVPPDALDPADAAIYDGRSVAANVVRALSLVPPEVVALADLGATQYLSYVEMRELVNIDRDLTRAQIEFVAVKVSAANECFY
jgi:hypothetical protein